MSQKILVFKNAKIKLCFKILARFLTLTLILALLLVDYLFIPINEINPTQTDLSTLSYFEAAEKFGILQSRDDANIRLECRSTLLTHCQKTLKSIVLFHGFTNCPKQFNQFSQLLFDQGYNVLIPIPPFHGLNDLNTRDQNKLKAAQILDLTQASVAIASGLGQQVETFGLSGGGVMSLWAGLNLPQVSKAIVVSPIMKPYATKDFPLNPVIKILQNIPDQYIYWDGELKDKAEFSLYAYKGFSTKAIAQFLEIGNTVLKQIQTKKTTNAKFILITSDTDQAVDNSMASSVLKLLKTREI